MIRQGILFIALLLICSVPLAAVAAKQVEAPVVEGVTITIDDEIVKLDDPVRMQEGRLFLPVARLTGSFGARASWDQDNEEVTIYTADGDQIVLGIGVPTVSYNDKRYMMDAAPFVVDGRTYIPLRYVAELMHAKVKWNAEELLAEIVSVQPVQAQSLSVFSQEADSYTKEDYELLAKITQVEAGYESYEGQLAVANVILNRVKHPAFPNTIKAVIYSGKQFPPAHNGLLDKSKPNASVLRATKDALNGKNNIEDAVYFFNPKVSKGAFWSSLDVIDTIGVHRFAK